MMRWISGAIACLTLVRIAEAVPLGPLPQSAAPLHYQIELTIIPDQPKFSGRTAIRVRLTEPTTVIWLHGNELIVSEAHVLDAQGRKHAASYRQAHADGVAELTIDGTLPAGEATLIFRHEAKFHVDGFGSGLASLRAGDHAYVSSIMFASEARRVFPSFDEPRFKTPYDVTLIAPSGQAVMANAPEVSSEPVGGGLQRVQFATSRPLPTYLVAFSVGPYDVRSGPAVAAGGKRKRPIPVRAFAARGKGEQLRYALDNTPAVVRALESYLGSAYPYEKLDLIAIPDPLERGGMENAAAISYGEYNLLSDRSSSPLHRRELMDLHAHELVHQWFGDLVTPAWWDDFWINESFSTFLAQRTLAQWAGGEDLERAGLRRGLEAMVADSASDAQEIRPRIETLADMSNGLNQLMYAKGSAVLEMFEHFAGPDAFRAGVRAYLQQFPYGTADTEQFLATFEKGSKHEVSAAALRSFLIQPGVPRLDVEWQCRDGTIEMALSQSRYVSLGSKLAEDRRWQLPVCVSYGESRNRRKHCQLLAEPRGTMRIPVKQCPSAVMPNADGIGYYRFTLAPEKRRALTSRIATLSPREALSLEDSLAADVFAGRISAQDYLQAVAAFASHPAWDVASAPASRMRFIINRVLEGDDRERARAFARELYVPVLQRARGSQSEEAAQLRRVLVPFLALDARDLPLRGELATTGRAYATAVDKLAEDPPLLAVALAVAAQTDGGDFVRALWERARTTQDAQFRENVLFALARLTEPALAEWVRGLALSQDLKPSEAAVLLSDQASTAENLPATWQWEQRHLAALAARITGYWQKNLVTLAGGFCDSAARKEVEATFKAAGNPLESAVTVLASTLEGIDHCIAMNASHGESVRAFFRGRD